MVTLSRVPPAGWDAQVAAPCQTVGFARAMSTMGYTPLYLSSERGTALGLVRGTTGPLRRVLSRANVFAPGARPEFVREVLEALAAWGVPHVKVGDTMWGVPSPHVGDPAAFRDLSVTERHTFVIDLAQDEAALLGRMDGAARKIRKAEREGVTVTEASSPADIDAYCGLSSETSARVRSRTAYTDFPPHFFHAIYRELAPSGVARFYIAWYKDQPLAGCLFLCSGSTMLYYLGGSGRDREMTAKQAPAAVFWHAIREAKRLGMTRFDLGGCTPTTDENDPRYGVYTFKKRWGGDLEVFYNLGVVLSPTVVGLQDRVVGPAWDLLHPLYFKLFRSATESAGPRA
jgi:hypothetical protein